jgi:hypothetical protein
MGVGGTIGTIHVDESENWHHWITDEETVVKGHHV